LIIPESYTPRRRAGIPYPWKSLPESVIPTRLLSSTFRIFRLGRSSHGPEDIFVGDKL
jgi:hypothetical protein